MKRKTILALLLSVSMATGMMAGTGAVALAENATEAGC